MNTREIILEILLELAKTDAYVNLLLADVLEKYDYLSPKEKAFIKRVTEGCVERRIQIDYVLDRISNVPVRKMKPFIRELLRMGAYQILFMESVPDAAACNEAVRLAGKRKFTSLRGYVNGVLREISRQKQTISYPDKEKDPISYLSILYSMPQWLTEYFLQSYDFGTVEKMFRAFLERGAVTLRIEESLPEATRQTYAAAWEEKGAVIRKHPYLSYAVQIEKAEGIRHLSGYAEGIFTVQDVSSMLVIEAADIREGQTIIDVCAAPGGKSLHAASKLSGTGRVLSFDLTQNKLMRMEENRIRMRKENMETAVGDARICREDLYELADIVLADVPCSGLGVIGKKPDIKYHVSEQSLADIIQLQKEILQNAVTYVKPGGILLYSTCTINPQENEETVKWLCDSFPFVLEGMDIDANLPEDVRKAEEKGMVQLLPGIHETDGFFFAKLRKKKPDIKSMTLPELQEQMLVLSEKPYRAKQLYEWMHGKLARDYEEMSNLPKSLKEKCRKHFTYTALSPVKVQESRIDGTKKFLFALSDGNLVESVWMRYKHGNSVCISSQVGCRMGCRFCASTIDGWERNLLPSEMLDQIYAVTRLTGERVSNVVVMGTGEPLDNYDNLLRFIRLLTDENGLHISQRSITVSTCGIVPKMRQLAQEKLQITLALSLHAATDQKRQALMPVARQYSLDELMKVCTYYFKQTGRRITFEYSLADGVNDTKEDVTELTRLLKPLNCHVNLIPINPVKERNFVQSERAAVEVFKNKLEKNGINVTIRREMGRDIDGACGQLRRGYMTRLPS